jgi:hypothetical protein
MDFLQNKFPNFSAHKHVFCSGASSGGSPEESSKGASGLGPEEPTKKYFNEFSVKKITRQLQQ